MTQARTLPPKKTRSILIFLSISMFIYHSPSFAFVLDYKHERDDNTSKKNATEPKQKIHDTSCLSEGQNSILHIPLNEISTTLSALAIEKQVELYYCSSQAGLNDIASELLGILLKKLPGGIEYLTNRLSNEHSDDRIVDLLLIFAGYGFEAYHKAFSKKGDTLTTEELPFPPETSRLLVSKAEEIKNDNQRNFLLDYLIPLLPYDEALARQALREEARKKPQK